MKTQSYSSFISLNGQLSSILDTLRQIRKFDGAVYLKVKANLLNDYFRENRLSGCVVGVSGGIDSALSLGILHFASQIPDSPIKKIVAALIPIFAESGATNQNQAIQRGKLVAEKFGIEPLVFDLTKTHQGLKKTMDHGFLCQGSPWASGQLVSYLRTPALYYLTSLLSDRECSSVVCGTTNRDEGAYLGYFGKASDGMVDLQLISDLHKSEVYKVASLLDMPREIMEAAPHGDVFDGRSDLEMMGVPYDFIELYLLFRSLLNEREKEVWYQSLSIESQRIFQDGSGRIEDLHSYNRHKYFSGNPSVHLDVYERAIPGGWTKYTQSEPVRSKSSFVNEISFSEDLVSKWESFIVQKPDGLNSAAQAIRSFSGSLFHLEKFLEPAELEVLLSDLQRRTWVPVGWNGILKDYRLGEPIGSWRTSTYDEKISDLIWRRLRPRIFSLMGVGESGPSEWKSGQAWRPIGINPLLRFIKYEKEGLLIPHYDGPFEYSPNRKTWMSLLIYLSDSDPAHGGATQFIRDPQKALRLEERTYRDSSLPAKREDIELSLSAKAGDALLFDHRLFHESSVLKSDRPKIVLRSDLIFDRCGWK